MAYTQFLEIYNPFTVPFLYEMRIHMYRRDQYMIRGQKVKDDENRLKEYLFIAFKENLILEKYFGHTLKLTAYQWPQSRVHDLENRIDPDTIYKSPVCSDLFRSFNERELWLFVAVVLFVLFVINLMLVKVKPEKAKHPL